MQPTSAASATPVIPRPAPEVTALIQSVNRDISLFLRVVGIGGESDELRDLKRVIQSLHRLHLHPFQHVEEQASEVNRLIAKARTHLPWLAKYEDSWPARIYLKRYVDGRRPHLLRTRTKHLEERLRLRSFHYIPKSLDAGVSLDDDDDTVIKDFLDSLAPGLTHRLDAFITLGIKDRNTLKAFLSWSQATQSQFLDESNGLLQLTNLEKKGLLVGCGLVAQKALTISLDDLMRQGFRT